MPFLIEDKEVKVIGLNDLSPILREVVADLEAITSSEAYAIIQITSSRIPQYELVNHLRNNHLVSKVLQQSPELRERFPGGKKPVVSSPNTWLVGAFEPGTTQVSQYGLFSKLDGLYYADYVRRVLGLGKQTRVDHKGLDVERLTGRVPGTVSVVLEREYLQGCSAIDFEPTLVQDLHVPDRMVEYPLGNERFYVARGEAFLGAYANLLRAYGVVSNLRTIPAYKQV